MKVYIIGVDAGRSGGLLASPYMEKELRVLGYEVEQLPVRDISSLRRALLAGAQPQSLILCPLVDKVQADSACIQAIAELCGQQLAFSEDVAHQLEKRGHLAAEEAQRLALLPEGARVFPCRQSLFPGFEVAGDSFHIVALPSDAEEQTSLFFSYLFQVLSKTSTVSCHSRVLRVMELELQQAEEALRDLLEAQSPCVAIYQKRSELIIRISDSSANRQQAAERCNSVIRTIVQRLGTHVYGIDVNGIEHALALKCAKKNIRLAFAESGSAGLAAKRFHHVDPEGQLICSEYSCQPEEMDLEKLGINDKIGKKFGPVSANVAAAMALGCSSQQEKDVLGLSISLPNA
ncbi:MAG: CinA family protein, partial [Negativibacillus sp.]|nr:CinA family protein [Negativibacillus sp.]